MRDPGLRAVLFDWDGTLVNTAEASYRCYEKLFGSYGIAFDREAFRRTYSPNWHLTYSALGLAEERWAEADARWLRLPRASGACPTPQAPARTSRDADATFSLSWRD